MSITHADIDTFNAFALSKLDSGGAESMNELFELFLIDAPEKEPGPAVNQRYPDDPVSEETNSLRTWVAALPSSRYR